MANEEHLGILREGVETWNRWRNKTKEVPDIGEGDFSGMNLSGSKLENANLCGANFEKADLYGANLENANLSRAHLCIADLSHANLSRANLRHADLEGADLSHSDLSHANLSHANLGGAYLSEANLYSAVLSGANLCGADLSHADLSAVDLSAATLNGADFSAAKLNGANLSAANLSGADFIDTDLNAANFENAIASFTKFANCDLSKVKGLDLVKHDYQSTIDIDTIRESKGKIPENFLRGCGVPANFITQINPVGGANDDLQFYSCFISYSSEDQDFARCLHGRMRDAHLQVWFAPEDMPGGKKLHEVIDEAIRVYDKLLIVLSAASLQSEWVMTELRRARKAQRQTGKRKLFPVRLVDMNKLKAWECFDADSGKDLAVELREYFIPDFSNWKDHDQFEAAFARLLKDLRAEERAK